MNDHVASDVHNDDCYEDENPTSPLVLKSLRGDMKQEQGDTITALDQGLVISNTTDCATVNQVLFVNSHELNVDFDAMGGDTDGERPIRS